MIDKYISSGSHVFVSGMTGSGKTYLCEKWLSTYDFVVKLDTKHEYAERELKNESAWIGLKNGEDFEIINYLDQIAEVKTNKIIYAPVPDEQEYVYFEEFFNWIYRRGNTILWVDELLSFTTHQTCPKNLKNIMIMGRSINIGVWCGSQRPSGVPAIVTANCTYFFTFMLRLYNDRKRMVEITGMPELINEIERYYFYYYKTGDSKIYKCKIK